MSDFRFELEDLLDFSDGEGLSSTTETAMSREIGKQHPGPLSTTGKDNNFSRGLNSTLGIGNVLMSQALFKDQATVLNRQEYMTSALLGGALTAEDTPGGSLGGGFDLLVPNDIKAYVTKKRRELSWDEAVDAAAAGGGATGSGAYNTEGYVFMANQLIEHPNFRLQSRGDKNGDANRVLQDLRDGLINPWLIATLKILSDNFAIYVGNFDATARSGHMSGSQHYVGNAVDIGDIGPKGSKWGEHKDAVEGDTALVQQVLSCLNSIHAPWRPSTVLCSAFPSFGGGGKVNIEGTSFSANADHGLGSAGNGHFHIDCKVRPAPSEIPPPKRTSTAAPPVGGVRRS